MHSVTIDGANALVIPSDPFGVGCELGDPALRRAAQDYCRQALAGLRVTNRISGDVILITAKGIKHSLHGARPPLMRSMVLLPQIMEQASKTGEVMDKAGRPDIVAIHKYEAELSDADAALIALVIARESREGVKHFYDLSFLAR